MPRISYQMCESVRTAQRVYKVWHIGAWNRNIGDWALAYQLHRMLNEQAEARGVHFDFYLVDSQRTWFHPGLVDQMNDEADLVLIGGGGLVFFRPEDKSVSGWSFNITPTELDRVRVPIVVHAIGYNRFEFDPNAFPAVTAYHLRQLQQRARLFSVRNQGTRRVLEREYGLDADAIEVVPDPGIRLYDRLIEIPGRRTDGGPVIAVNWAGDRPYFRYPEPAEENARIFTARMKNVLRRAVEELDAQIMFLPHLAGVDTELFEYFAEGLPAGSIFSTHDTLPFLYAPPGEMLYVHVPFFTNIYRHASLVLGMRLHSCVLAYGAGTPFLALGSHPKLRYFVEDAEVPDYTIPMVDPARENEDGMFDRVRSALADSTFRSTLAASHARQLAVLQQFNDRIVSIFPSARAGDVPTDERRRQADA